MNLPAWDLALAAQTIALAMFSVAIALAFVRLARGPTLPDRVVALDLISLLAAGLLAVYSRVTEHALLLDVATVLALIAFLGTVAFARYLEKRAIQ
jgi:multicomponent Na+:H+ antiporter subunit F